MTHMAIPMLLFFGVQLFHFGVLHAVFVKM